jgi:hypothetical protein
MEIKVNVKNKFRLERRKCCGNFVQLNSTTQTIRKNVDKIVSVRVFEKKKKKKGITIKRLSKPKRNDVEEALLKWFKEKRSENVSCLLMATAEGLARVVLQDKAFVCATWMDRQSEVASHFRWESEW